MGAIYGVRASKSTGTGQYGNMLCVRIIETGEKPQEGKACFRFGMRLAQKQTPTHICIIPS